MKTFYSLEDIEKLAAQGVRELVVDEDTVLTDVARDTAAQLGFRLTPKGRATTTAVAVAPAPVAVAPSSGKPRGCQHGPLTSTLSQSKGSAPAPAAARTDGRGGRLVDDLVGAVKQLANKGSAS